MTSFLLVNESVPSVWDRELINFKEHLEHTERNQSV